MREVIEEIRRWRADGRPVALATVARVSGSGLAPLGAVLACTDDLRIAGSVSGGCIESAVYAEAQEVLDGGPARLLRYGVSDELAWSVGLACGGQVEVWVERVEDTVLDAVTRAIAAGRRIARATVVAGTTGVGSGLTVGEDGPDGPVPAPPELGAALHLAAQNGLVTATPARVRTDLGTGPVDLLVQVVTPPDRLIIVGAVHIAVPLVTMAAATGYRTTVVDARPAFATRERFPHADDLILARPADVLAEHVPDRSTDVVVLTHDDRVDIPALRQALRSPARYIGILGSRSHHAQRVTALRERGVTEPELARIHAPIGLPIGAVGPEEIAVAVLAELVATRHPRPAPDRDLGRSATPQKTDAPERQDHPDRSAIAGT
jgi:xanthine dehydrogenase accessory factor